MYLEARFVERVIDSQRIPGLSEAEAVTSQTQSRRESLSEAFNEEIDAWARHAMRANGFGDFL